MEISALPWNALCWYGTLRGRAADVAEACEKAVGLMPQHGDYRDNRGLNRVLRGDTVEAIEDLQAYIDWPRANDEVRGQRQKWIAALEWGESPFTEEVLEELRSQ